MNNTYKTTLSKELVNIFDNEVQTLSFIDINNILLNKNLKYNKTSIYRQLETMLKDGLIKVIDTPNGKVWEIKTNREHTHLICDRCENTVCLDFDLNIFQQITDLNKHINVQIRSLSLSGLCSKCL